MTLRPVASSAARCLRATSASRFPTAARQSHIRSFSASAPSRNDASSSPPPRDGQQQQQPFTTVSPDEVAHFNALASSWWDPQGPSRFLHLMNPLRHDFIQSCRASVPAPDSDSPGTDKKASQKLRYLDIGCGGGIFAESAARLPDTASVTALDPTPEVLAVAKAHARRDPALAGTLRYLNIPVEHFPPPETPDQGYDVVSVFEVLEHVTDPARFLDSCTPFVRPGGWLVMSTIARTWMSWLTTNLIAEDILNIVPRGTHDWRKYINDDELARHFTQSRSGWSRPRCMGVIYIPGVGWREVSGSEKVGNYFFAVRRDPEP